MKLLMVRPTHFNIEYSINPHMLTESGELNKINHPKALRQWEEVRTAFEQTGAEVVVMDGGLNLPDMVFSANHAVVIDNIVIMGNYYSKFRQGETKLFEEFYLQNNFEVIKNDFLEGELFEGTGDAIWNADQSIMFGGYGFRSNKKAYELINKKFDIKIVPLKLVSEDYYHLDTCFAVLNDDSVAVIKSAFDSDSFNEISKHFKNVIEIDPIEGKQGFAGNAFCPNKKHVVVQRGNKKFNASVEALGLEVLEVDTSEYIKAGGSVFCMKHVIEY